MIMDRMIFVFGSNEGGYHGAGAAKYAYERCGARYHKGYGHYGKSFAIPTKNERIQTLPIEDIKPYVNGFLAYAKGKPDLQFQVTRIGCGLAGYKNEDIAPMFIGAPSNCWFDTAWKPILGDTVQYWGTM